MLSQRIKDLCFALIYPLSKLNYYRYRFLNYLTMDKKYTRSIRLNIGSGRHYLKDFVNIEGNIFQKKDIWLDIRTGFPFSDNSVNAIYASNIFEHFYIFELFEILSECRRVLKPEGVIRIVVPDLEKAINAYTDKEISWFIDFPTEYESLGGKFFNSLLCDNQHKLIFDFSFMKEILRKNGFKKIIKVAPTKSKVFSKNGLDKIENENSLIVESEK